MLGDQDPATLRSLRSITVLAARNGQMELAEEHAEICLQAHVGLTGEEAAKVNQCLDRLITTYEEAGESEKAAAWRARL